MVQDTDTPQNKVTANIWIKATDEWNITNIPSGTTYKIEEVSTKGYEFVEAREIGNTSNKVQAPADPEITGGVPVNTVTEVEFTNKISPTALEVQKVWTDDGQEGIDHIGQTIEYKIYRTPYRMVNDPDNEGEQLRINYPVQEIVKTLEEEGAGKVYIPTMEGFTGVLSYNAGNSDTSWKERVTLLPKAGEYTPADETDAVQVLYEYYVTEETEIPGYKTSIDGREITEGTNKGTYSYIITNEPMGPTDQETQIDVKKEWKTADGEITDIHRNESISLKVTQKKYEAKVVVGTGDQAEPKMLYPITINLSDKNGNNNNPRVNHTYVVYVPQGAWFTMEPHWVENGSNPQEHTVYVYGNGVTATPRSQTPSTTTYSDKPGRTYYYPGATFTIPEVDSAKEITLELHAGNDKWMDLYDMYHLSDKPSYTDRHQWTCEMTSSYEIIWDLDEMLENVLKGADGPAHIDPVLIETNNPTYSMTLTQNESGLPTIISKGENAPGRTEGSENHLWEGSITHLSLYEYKDSGDDAGSSFIYTYELAEAAIDSDTVNTTDPPENWSGQTTSYFVKWDQDTQTGQWTLTNQLKNEIKLTIHKVDKADLNKNNFVPLSGAKFKLMKYKIEGEGNDRHWVEDADWGPEDQSEIAENPSGSGIFNFGDLKFGYYEIVETQFPAGYIQPDENPMFQLRENPTSHTREAILVHASGESIGQPIDGNATDLLKIGNESAGATITYGNTPGAELPSSGGPGTTWIYLIGSILLICCGTLLVARRRMWYKS